MASGEYTQGELVVKLEKVPLAPEAQVETNHRQKVLPPGKLEGASLAWGEAVETRSMSPAIQRPTARHQSHRPNP